MDEVFFFLYHMHMDRFKTLKLDILERRYMIDKFIAQKQSEKEEMEKEKRRK
jgi:hypothetical protein